MKKPMESMSKQELEIAIVGYFPQILERIGLSNYAYSKDCADKELFKMNDKIISYLYTPNYNIYKLSSDETEQSRGFQASISATVTRSIKLDLSRVNFQFDSIDNLDFINIVEKYKFSPYFANLREIADFILSRSNIVSSVSPKINFTPDGDLVSIELHLNYFEDSSIFKSKESYYTNSICIYDKALEKIYKIENVYDALLFSKMFFLSVHDQDFNKFFECDEWSDLYDKFKQEPERMLSVYDMSRF